MNKTVNINLANMLFHIDEKAYQKLQRYLEAIKKSFSGTKGSDEIIADVEARIAELFYEKMENERQVITQKEVDEVIAIMGQPEDYMVDEDIFADAPGARNTSSSNQFKNQKALQGYGPQIYRWGMFRSGALPGHRCALDPYHFCYPWSIRQRLRSNRVHPVVDSGSRSGNPPPKNSICGENL